MEKRMKNFSWAVAVFLLSLLLVVSIGCEKKSTSSDNGNSSGQVGSVTLSIGTDTLRFLPGDSASTTITVIVSDKDGNIMQGQKVNVVLADPQLGYLEFLDTDLRDTTNAQGRVDLLFTAIGTAGDNIFTATAGNVLAWRRLAIREQSLLVGTLQLAVTPNSLQAAVGMEAVADVKVVISDITGVAISGLSLQMSTTGGRLAPLPATNDSGIARTKWFSNDEFCTDETPFFVRVNAGELEREVSVVVKELRDQYGTLVVTSDKQVVRADGCITKANITATFKDQFGSAIPNDTIRFAVPGLIGSIQSSAVTNALGQATLEFCEQGVPNAPGSDSVQVIARYPLWGLADTVNIWVAEAEPVTFVEISCGSVVGTAGIDSISILLDARFESGLPVDGHWAHFTSFPCGEFYPADSIRIMNGSLEVPLKYIMCQQIPIGTDVPWVQAQVQDSLSNKIVFRPQPGHASKLVFDDPPLYAEVNTPLTLVVVVQDTFQNFVEDGQLVQFTSDLGSIGAISQTVGGFATTNFNPGTLAGEAQIKAFTGNAVDSTVIVVGSDLPNTIQLTVSEPSLEVAGTGGVEWTQLQATVLDANGNEVEDGTWVRFRIVAGPPGSGININNQGIADSTQTANGMAVATLNAGNAPGAVLIEACVDGLIINDQGEPEIIEICATYGGMSVVAGPPAYVFIYPNESGVDGGGAAWDLELSALVVDQQQNPVRCGVSVFFEVFPPSTAQILSRNVTTCNENMAGDSVDGVAYTVLRFLSPQTFNTVQITATTANGMTTSIQFELPLQEGTLQLNCAPGSWHFGEVPGPCRIQCIATVQDGHHRLINGANVYFTSQRGRLFTNEAGSGEAVSFAFTGGGNPDGQAILWLVSTAAFIFPDPVTPEISGEVRAVVMGYAEASNAQVINFRRGSGQ